MPRPDAHLDPNRGHIDPGDPGRVETYHPNGPDAGVPYGGDGPKQWRHDEKHPSHLCEPPWCGSTPSDGGWHSAHFSQKGVKSSVISQAAMGPMPTAAELVDAQQGSKARPEREGPDYSRAGMNDPEVDDAFWIKLSLAPEAIPKRTEWILKNVVPTALRSFVRHNLRYRNTDEALGLQGQFSEIYHITAKLKRQIWDRTNPESVARGEVQEELESLIGHALLALDLLDKGNKDGR